PKSAFEVAEPIRQGHADFVDAPRQAFANLTGAPGKGRVEILDSLGNRLADFLGAPGEHLPQLSGFAIQRRVDIGAMKPQRLIDLSGSRGKTFGNGAARFVKFPGNHGNTVDDALLELIDMAVQRLADRGRAAT